MCNITTVENAPRDEGRTVQYRQVTCESVSLGRCVAMGKGWTSTDARLGNVLSRIAVTHLAKNLIRSTTLEHSTANTNDAMFSWVGGAMPPACNLRLERPGTYATARAQIVR